MDRRLPDPPADRWSATRGTRTYIGRSVGAGARARVRGCRPHRRAARARGIEWVPVGCRRVDRGVCVDRRRGQRRARGVTNDAECGVVVERASSCLDGVRKRLLHVQRSRARRARGAGRRRAACAHPGSRRALRRRHRGNRARLAGRRPRRCLGERFRPLRPGQGRTLLAGRRHVGHGLPADDRAPAARTPRPVLRPRHLQRGDGPPPGEPRRNSGDHLRDPGRARAAGLRVGPRPASAGRLHAGRRLSQSRLVTG
jgi:hypothetical protein